MKTMRNYSSATYLTKRSRRFDVTFSPFSIDSSCSFNLSEVEFLFFCKSLSWTFQEKFHRRLARENWSHMIERIDNPSDERTLVTTSNSLMQLESTARLLDT